MTTRNDGVIGFTDGTSNSTIIPAVFRPVTTVSPTVTTERTPDGYLVEAESALSRDSPWLVIFGIIIGIIIIALIVIFMFFVFIDESVEFPNIETVFIDNEINDTTGASSDGSFELANGTAYRDMSSCLAGPTREWSSGTSITFNTCDCLDPFFGPECFREAYNDKYTSIGTPSQSNIIATFSSPQTADRLSFPFAGEPGRLPDDEEIPTGEIICTQLCDQDQECLGVWWIQADPPNLGIGQSEAEKPKCQLISGEVVVRPGTNIPYSPAMDSVLYMKGDVDPQFKDRVFVYQGAKPLRYWTVDSFSSPFGDNRSQTMFNRQLIKFDWTPQIVINSTGCLNSADVNCPFGQTWFGFFSNRSIDLTNNNLLRELINMASSGVITVDGQEYVVVRPGQTQLAFPASWKELWGAFVDPSTIPGMNAAMNTAMFNNVSMLNQDVQIINSGVNLDITVSPRRNQYSSYSHQGNIYGQTITSTPTYNRSSRLPSTIRRNRIQSTGSPQKKSLSTIHTVNWSSFSFSSSGEGKDINIRVHDLIRIRSIDDDYHDVVSTDSEWYITNFPINIGVDSPLDITIPFNSPGTFYLKDRMNPRTVRLIVRVG